MNPLTPYNFIFELPLYAEIEINDENRIDLYKLFHFDGKIEAYNPILKQETTYQVYPVSSFPRSRFTAMSNYEGFNEFKLSCLRNEYPIRVFAVLRVFETEGGQKEHVLIKTGQFPSIADLHISKVKNYDKVLDREKIKEFTRAIGLAANGVGTGSFVYLRRIFEHLIEEAHLKAKNDSSWDDSIYDSSRMTEKIQLLKDYLPAFLVTNKSIYGILSKGIHELKEQECLKYFEALKTGIELILDEKVEQLNRENKLKEVQQKLAGIVEEVNKPK